MGQISLAIIALIAALCLIFRPKKKEPTPFSDGLPLPQRVEWVAPNGSLQRGTVVDTLEAGSFPWITEPSYLLDMDFNGQTVSIPRKAAWNGLWLVSDGS